MKHLYSIFLLIVLSLSIQAQVPHPNQGLRAEWMKGALGLLWLPENNYNGNIEGVSIEPFLEQIQHLKTIDYVQLPLTSPNIFSPVHTAPHAIIESFWEGDTDENGFPINLVVPRSTAEDPLLNWLKAVKAAGLRTEIYVNSYNLLARDQEGIIEDYPDISSRWEEYCNTNAEVQTFINSQTYHTDGVHERRPYMFCYAEFILKEYAIRYGDLIDAWCFDSAHNIIESECGDDSSSGILEDQRIYQAFANACHAGNPDAAISFNEGVGFLARPFTTPTLFDDYTFGHPFGGAGDMVETEDLYNRNFAICEYMDEYNGLPFETRDNIDWNDNVVGHFFPKQSTTSWNSGGTPCLTNEQFVEWNSEGLINGGAITWGTPLVVVNLENTSSFLFLQEYALEQFELLDEHLSKFQYPNVPNLARTNTVLNDAYFETPYTHTLIEGNDFWDPEGNETINLSLINQPAWLTIEETSSGVWVLKGIPTETTTSNYEFTLRASNASGDTDRLVNLNIIAKETVTSLTSNVQIQAEANTDYGTNNVAAMISEVQTAPDNLATYQVSIKVTPETGKSILSRESGGDSTENSFAVSTIWNDSSFAGNDNDWIENIGEIEIINFNANGGNLGIENITSVSFNSVIIVNGQSVDDNVALNINNSNFTYGKTRDNTYELDLEPLTGGTSITNFSIGTGNDSTTNKWSIDGITVKVNFDILSETLSIEESLVSQKNELKLYPNPTTSIINISNIEKNSLFTLYDVSGRLLITKELQNTVEQVDLKNLSEGTYYVRVKDSNNGKNVNFKVLKK